MSDLGAFLPLIIIVVFFWLLFIRPQQRRQRELQAMQRSLAPGDEILLTSGVFGRVAEITDEHVVVEIADGVTIRVVRGAIGQVITKPEQGDVESDAAEPGSEEN